jgi:hypothetical protein
VGCGTTTFLPRLLAGSVREVVAYDPEARGESRGNMVVVPEAFGSGRLVERAYTHVVCVSVIEHVDTRDRPGFFGALDAVPVPLVLTLEHGPRKHGANLDMTELYELGSNVKRHYCTRIESCPVWADNSFSSSPSPLWRPLGVVFSPEGSGSRTNVPIVEVE